MLRARNLRAIRYLTCLRRRERQVRGWRRPEIIAEQAAHPRGLLGWIIGRVMAWETASDNEVTIALADLKGSEHVLEVVG